MTKEARRDLAAWCEFLEDFNGVSLLLSDRWQSSAVLKLQTDASGKLGFAAVLGSHWCASLFNKVVLDSNHITILELYPILLAIRLWHESLRDSCVLFLCDNIAVVHIINSMSSKDKSIMKLVRKLVVLCMRFNILFAAKHVPGHLNVLADKLSRNRLQEARLLCPTLDRHPSQIPEGCRRKMGLNIF